MQIREKRRRTNRATGFVLIFCLVGVAVIGALLAPALLGAAGPAGLGPGAPELSAPERALLAAYLSTRAQDLRAPAGPNAAPVPFSVEMGETAGAVAERLAEQGLVRDAQLLTYYLRYEGIDDEVEAGDFILRQTMTILEVARALTDARAREVILRVTEGWRLEQIAEALEQHGALAGSADEFLALAGPNSPRATSYGFLSGLPPGASLEGYLFPDTYLLRPDTGGADIIDKMLANFAGRLPADYQTKLAARGMTLHQAITVASLIEREAAVDYERALIASVIYNRLAVGQMLEIDATVQYALGAPGNWWPRLDGIDLRGFASPYNTYAQAGLPPGPIANPGLDSLLAAAEPADTPYLYYRALCDGSGRHAFAVTYAEHLANACQ